MTQLRRFVPKMFSRTAAVVATVACLYPLQSIAQDYSGLNIFGDSLVDTGNLFNLADLPPTPPYNQKFSNGSIWVEPLAAELGVSPVLSTELMPNMLPTEGINFALAGSLSSNINVGGAELPGLQQQIEAFGQLAPALPASSEAVFTLLAGGNDYNAAISNPDLPTAALETLPDQVTDNLAQAVTDLIDSGARHLLVANLPNLGQQPFAQQLNQLNPQSASLLTALSAEHNQLLDRKLSALAETSGAEIVQLDLDGLFNEISTRPDSFGFTNVEDACLTNFQSGFIFEGVCDNPDEFLFWDDVHPTDAVHQLIAQLAIDTLSAKNREPESIPEPYSVLPILLLGGGLFYTRSRHRRKTAS